MNGEEETFRRPSLQRASDGLERLYPSETTHPSSTTTGMNGDVETFQPIYNAR